jgi:hypothetical protein
MQQIVRTLTTAEARAAPAPQVLICDHYHEERNHQGLDNRLISSLTMIDPIGRVRRRPRLGGLLNFYERAA